MMKSKDLRHDRFWGHLGIELHGVSHAMWWPVSHGEASRIENLLSSGSSKSCWFVVETLNNRTLLINAARWESLSLLDDADEWPEGESVGVDGLDDYSGMPVALYRRMAEWADGDVDFEANNTDGEKEEALAAIEGGGFSNRSEDLRALLRHTVIHYSSGKSKSYEAGRDDLLEVMAIEGDNNARSIRISKAEGVIRYFALDKICMIDIPTIELEAAGWGAGA